MKFFDEAPDFVFGIPDFDWESGEMRLPYSFEGECEFIERIIFTNPPKLSGAQALAFERAMALIHYLAGVSYYKAYCPKVMRFKAGAPSPATAALLQKVYSLGLAEFAFENNIDIRNCVYVPVGATTTPPAPVLNLKKRALVPVGGGKDSVVSIEALRAKNIDFSLFAVGGKKGAAAPIAACAQVAGDEFVYITRTLDKQLTTLNAAGALNGHIPITAIISAIAAATAILYDYDSVVFSNEYSASAPNLVKDGFAINHQYSKSLEFEQDFASYLNTHIAQDLHYFSLLRPLSEGAIAKIFATHKAYHPVFRSCNTAFRQDALLRGTHWCCQCPKCRFVFLALAPFMPKAELIQIFGQNLLANKDQLLGFEQLCGLADFKPFECVGEVEESALLMEALLHLPEWQNDFIVRQCAQNKPDFEARFAQLLAPKNTQNIPPAYQGVI